MDMTHEKHEVVLNKDVPILLACLFIIDISLLYKFERDVINFFLFLVFNFAVIAVHVTTKRPFKYVIDFKNNKLVVCKKAIINSKIIETEYNMNSLSYSLKTEPVFRAIGNKAEVLTIYIGRKPIEQIVSGLRGWTTGGFHEFIAILTNQNVRRRQ